MAYRDYRAPGANVYIERTGEEEASIITNFLPVFVGTGMTSRSRLVEQKRIKADVREYPLIKLEWSMIGHVNLQMFEDTDFTLSNVQAKASDAVGEELTLLVENTDYKVITPAAKVSDDGILRTTIEILDTVKYPNTVLLYDYDVTIENTDSDFDIRLMTADDRYYSRDVFGPIELKENGKEFLNDVAIAAEIAFKTGVDSFFYMEVPRAYGEQPTTKDFIDAFDKIYYETDAYRIVPLTNDADVFHALSGFTTSLSNPVDRREVVGFTHVDPGTITDINDINELKEKVGGFSEGMNNERIMNIFGGTSVELVISNKNYVLPMYFLNAGIVAYDATLGMADPLSTREITVFSKLNGPRFRPRQWDQLAEMGVFIVYKPTKRGGIVIRHQLTTKQSNAAEYQEYSMVRTFDAVTKRLRDRMSPYAGKHNITDGYMEKIDATFTSSVEEVKSLGWAKDIEVLTPWQLRTVRKGTTSTEDNRNLVGRFKLKAVYPGNNIDVYLVV